MILPQTAALNKKEKKINLRKQVIQTSSQTGRAGIISYILGMAQFKSNMKM